jgi:trimethylamine---corrinoid protein Co-methyltransferase
MYDRMQELTTAQITQIHNASMSLLKNTGIVINEEEALSKLTIKARNPLKSVTIGEDDFALLPGHGAPFIMTTEDVQRKATMEDYDSFCKLIQTSKHLDMNGWMMVEPFDMQPETVHMDMMLSSMLLCDKPLMVSPVSREGSTGWH